MASAVARASAVERVEAVEQVEEMVGAQPAVEEVVLLLEVGA